MDKPDAIAALGALAQETRLDEGNLRQRPCRAVIKKLRDGPGEVEIFRAPDREERDITEVIAPS